MKRYLTAILIGFTLLGISACGGQPQSEPWVSEEMDRLHDTDPAAYQKAYCKEQGWTYEEPTEVNPSGTCKS